MTKKNIRFSILDLAIVAQGSSLQQTFAHALQLAQNAEALGYTRYWLAEHHNAESIGSSATSILIGYVAQGTKNIRVGSGGIMLPNHSPLIIAEQFGTLAALYPNRIDLGLGRAPGTDQETARAIRSDFMMAAQSFPQEIKKIETYFSAENKTAKVRAPIAEGAEVPMYILGSSTDSAHLAAAKGLPYAFASHFATTQLFPALRIYRDEFKSSTALAMPYVMAGVNIIIADTDEEAERMSTSFIRMIIGIFTGNRTYMQAPTTITEDLREFMQHPQVQQMMKYSFIGSKATVKKKVLDFLEETQADELIAVTNIFDPAARINSYKAFAAIMKEINDEQ